jgi:hypothetical protein
MSYFSQSKTPNILCRQSIMNKLLMQLALWSVEVDNGLGVEEQGDIRPDAETELEIIAGMCSDGKGVVVLFNIDCFGGP